jgi:hypothetical protein
MNTPCITFSLQLLLPCGMQPSLSNPTNSSTSERIRELQEKIGDSEFDRNLLQPMDKFASGSSGDL